MRMNLKNKMRKKNTFKIKFTTKNLFIFLISLAFLAFVMGILFFIFLDDNDKKTSLDLANNLFLVPSKYNYLKIIKDTFLENIFNFFLIWILGISIIGIFIVILLFFFNFFSLGYIASSIVCRFGAGGIFGFFCYLFPSKIIFLIMFFLLNFFSIKFSYKLILLCFSKKDINIKFEIRKYFKILVFSFVAALVISFLESFVSPIFIKMFINF